jgi:hypothetical protein
MNDEIGLLSRDVGFVDFRRALLLLTPWGVLFLDLHHKGRIGFAFAPLSGGFGLRVCYNR